MRQCAKNKLSRVGLILFSILFQLTTNSKYSSMNADECLVLLYAYWQNNTKKNIAHLALIDYKTKRTEQNALLMS